MNPTTEWARLQRILKDYTIMDEYTGNHAAARLAVHEQMMALHSALTSGANEFVRRITDYQEVLGEILKAQDDLESPRQTDAPELLLTRREALERAFNAARELAKGEHP